MNNQFTRIKNQLYMELTFKKFPKVSTIDTQITKFNKKYSKYDIITKKWINIDDVQLKQKIFQHREDISKQDEIIINKINNNNNNGDNVQRVIIGTDNSYLIFKYSSQWIHFQQYFIRTKKWSKVYELTNKININIKEQINILNTFPKYKTLGLEIKDDFIVSFASNELSICIFNNKKKIWRLCKSFIKLPWNLQSFSWGSKHLYDNSMYIYNIPRDKIIVNGFCRKYYENISSIYSIIPKYLQMIVVNYYLNEEIYLIYNVFHSDIYPDSDDDDGSDSNDDDDDDASDSKVRQPISTYLPTWTFPVSKLFY